MKKTTNRGRDVTGRINANQVSEKLQTIEEQLAQMQYALDELRSQAPTMPEQAAATIPEPAQPSYTNFPEPPMFTPQANPFVYQPTAKNNGWIDQFLTMLEDPKVRQLIRSLTKKVEEESRKHKRK